MCILAIEFSFTEKLAGIPGGGGSKVCGPISQNFGGQSLEGPSRAQLECCE